MLAGTGSTLAWLSVAGLQAQAPDVEEHGRRTSRVRPSLARGRVQHPRALSRPWPWRGADEPAVLRPGSGSRAAQEDRQLRYARHHQPAAAERGWGAAAVRSRRARGQRARCRHHARFFTARRYEEFDTFEAFKASFERHQRSVELAEPVLRKHKMKLAIENHKGWRAAEHVAWINRLGSEWIGACYDSATTWRSARIGRNAAASRAGDDLRQLQGHGGGAVR